MNDITPTMTLHYVLLSFSVCMSKGDEDSGLEGVPTWQQQIRYNDIAHLFHSMYREMWIPFEAPNRTAGDIIMKKMEKTLEGTRTLNHLTDVTPEQEFHKKYLQPVRFMVMRGIKQWNLIEYSDTELSDKYGWRYSEIEKFREMYKEIDALVNEMRDFLRVRHVDLDHG